MDTAFGWLALALWVAFFAVDALGRGYVHWRKTGSAGTPGPGKVLRPAELLSVSVAFVGTLTTVTGAVLAATAALGAVRYFDITALRAVGAVVAVMAIGMVWIAQSNMGASWRAGVDESERTELVRTGLFAVIRNPIFTFIIVAAAGLALMAPNIVSLAGVVVLTAGIELHVRLVEEPYLRRIHGDPYRDYTARVGRFVPGIGRTTDRTV